MSRIRFTTLWPLLVAALALLFAQLEPEPSRGLPFLAAWAFWVLHIGLGLALAIVATDLIGPRLPRPFATPSLRLAVGGLAGSLLFAPLALALEAVFPGGAVENADDGAELWLAALGLPPIAIEWLELAPSYLFTWAILNLAPAATARAAMSPPTAPLPGPQDIGTAASAEPQSAASLPAPAEGVSVDAGDAVRRAFLARLPPVIGTDIAWVRSDLHYLAVHTARGQAMILGTLAEAEAALADAGLRVHRSFWISTTHLRRVARRGAGWFCEMADGTRIPISRRRVAEVKSRVGADFVLDAAG